MLHVISHEIKKKLKKSSYALAIFLLMPILPVQASALTDQDASFDHLLAALATEIGIHDQAQNSDSNANLDNPLIKGIKNIMGQKQMEKSNVQCTGNIETITKIAGEAQYDRISGWFYDPTAKRSPAALFITDNNNNIVGYALIGIARPDVAKVIDKAAGYSGFKGYILAKAVNRPLSLQGNNPSCTFSIPRIPAGAFS